MVVDGKIIVELKAIEQEHAMHRAQSIHYRKSSGLKPGLLVNVGKMRLGLQRVVFTKH
ncbi:MAG: GxxExxY protein [Planctomycetes bacterium]|jgi:GxxExxY protein|nr:GxxExxY protein [Planctomycetota bacterium]